MNFRSESQPGRVPDSVTNLSQPLRGPVVPNSPDGLPPAGPAQRGRQQGGEVATAPTRGQQDVNLPQVKRVNEAPILQAAGATGDASSVKQSGSDEPVPQARSEGNEAGLPDTPKKPLLIGWDDPLEIPIEVPRDDPDLRSHRDNLQNVLGKGSDGDHAFPPNIVPQGDKLFYQGKLVSVTTLEELDGDRKSFVDTNNRVIAATAELGQPQTVFSPYNGGETIGLGSPNTTAIDILQIGTRDQVDALYENPYARAIYVADKLDRGHSFSGVVNELGYAGAMLRWDIEKIQGGNIDEVTYLDGGGRPLKNNQEHPTGIRIAYTTAGNQQRVHEQYSCDSYSLPGHVREQVEGSRFDGLYLRGTHHLVTSQTSEYRRFVKAVRSGGVVVSDAPMDLLVNGAEEPFAQTVKVPLPYGDFGYAGRYAKISAGRDARGFVRQGYVSLLQKAYLV